MPSPSLPTKAKKRRDQVRRTPVDGFDSPLKEAQFAFFRGYMQFFFGFAHDDIDWTKGFVSLDTELRQIAGKQRKAPLRVDSLFRVTRKSGEGQLVLIHSEFQSQYDATLAERIFRYNYRAFDAQKHEVVSFVILGDLSPSWRPDRHGWSLWGCEMGIRFPVVKLIDYVGREEELKASDNPFGLMVFAYLKTRETQHDMEKRRHFKMQATRALYEKNYTPEEVRLLFRTIDWLMQLPPKQEIIYLEELNQLEAEKGMPYQTSVERISMKRGLQQGRQEGFAQGRQEGRQEGFVSLLMSQLSQRFGQVPDWVAQKLSSAPPEALENWGRRVLDARSFEEIFA